TFWWICSSVMLSILNIENLFKEHAIEVLDVVLWLVNLLLLFCAFQNLGFFVTQSGNQSDADLSEPLLGRKSGENARAGLCNASILSKVVFSWVNPLLKLGYTKALGLEDIPSVVPEDEADTAHQLFVHAWENLFREKDKNNNNSTKNLALWSLVRVHLKENILIAFYALIRTICVVVSPIILYAFVNYSNRSSTEKDLKDGLSILVWLIVTKVFESLSQRHWFFDSRRSGMKMRSALMVVVYQKQLRLSSPARMRHSAGEIVNYIAVDAYRMGETRCSAWASSFHNLWTAQCAICKGDTKVSVSVHVSTR
ncbi:hypothetical protein PIB30_081697, partial [Stylosanthes scabra]|nr:hypothetical protein [Stylosanthes scabra]